MIEHVARIVLHHSASPRDTTTRELIDQWHKAKGWEGVGYHYVIEANGEIKIGRELPQEGAHLMGMNKTSIGICVVGDNTQPDQQWTPVQWHALKKLVDALLVVWPGTSVVNH